MSFEIERKFLVKGEFEELSGSSHKIIQGFLSTDPERSVRVRIKGDKAFLTVKGIGDKTGVKRFEFETEIPVNDAEELLKLCKYKLIKKTRFHIKVGKHLYETDKFEAENHGLILAEIELSDENEEFIKPDWLGDEVTGDERFYNLYLSEKPFTTWNK